MSLKKFEKNDDKLDITIDMLAEGAPADEITAELKRQGFETSHSYVSVIKTKYQDIITERAYFKSKELLRRVPLANQFNRVKLIESIVIKLEKIIQSNLENEHLTNNVIKATELLLKALRQIAEETGNIGPALSQTNQYVFNLKSMSKEEREAIVSQAIELRNKIQSEIYDAEIIDVTSNNE